MFLSTYSHVLHHDFPDLIFNAFLFLWSKRTILGILTILIPTVCLQSSEKCIQSSFWLHLQIRNYFWMCIPTSRGQCCTAKKSTGSTSVSTITTLVILSYSIETSAVNKINTFRPVRRKSELVTTLDVAYYSVIYIYIQSISRQSHFMHKEYNFLKQHIYNRMCYCKKCHGCPNSSKRGCPGECVSWLWRGRRWRHLYAAEQPASAGGPQGTVQSRLVLVGKGAGYLKGAILSRYAGMGDWGVGEVLGSLEPVDVGLWVNSSRPAGHIAIKNVVMELVVALWQIKRWSYYTGQRWCFTIKVQVLH